MDHDNGDPGLSGGPYSFYHDDGYPGLSYASPTHVSFHQVAQPPEMLQMRQLNLLSHHGPAADSSGGGAPYEHPISPPVSGSDVSTDSHPAYHPHPHPYSRESSSGAGSPPARRNQAQHRYHPLGGRRGRRSSTNDERELSDEGEQDPISPQSTGGMSSQAMAESLANSRKEATRKQRIEAEQRRRDELREGYARLKNVLPSSNQKSSKVSLLERATNYIANIDQSNKILHAQLGALEAEVTRLREMNERLSITVAHHTGQMPTEMDLGLPPPPLPFDDPSLHVDTRPLSPPPDLPSGSGSGSGIF